MLATVPDRCMIKQAGILRVMLSDGVLHRRKIFLMSRYIGNSYLRTCVVALWFLIFKYYNDDFSSFFILACAQFSDWIIKLRPCPGEPYVIWVIDSSLNIDRQLPYPD